MKRRQNRIEHIADSLLYEPKTDLLHENLSGSYVEFEKQEKRKPFLKVTKDESCPSINDEKVLSGFKLLSSKQDEPVSFEMSKMPSRNFNFGQTKTEQEEKEKEEIEKVNSKSIDFQSYLPNSILRKMK